MFDANPNHTSLNIIVKESTLYQNLEEIAEKLQIKVACENLRKHHIFSKGGTYRFKETRVVLMAKGLTLSEKIDILADALAQYNLEQIYMPPAVRKLIESKSVSLPGKKEDDTTTSSPLQETPGTNGQKTLSDN